MTSQKVLIYGGKGALGSVCVAHFKSKGFWVGSIDLSPSEEADANVVVTRMADWEEQDGEIQSRVSEVLNGDKVDAIICVAGGWAGGNAASKDLVKSASMMSRQSVWTSIISASLAAHHLKEGGILTLTGAIPALEGTSGMIGYGMAKAAVHQLTKSLAQGDGGLPKGAKVAAILPMTLDTPMNRKFMPDADQTAWTPMEFVADMFHGWVLDSSNLVNGSLVKLITTDGNTVTEAV